MVKWWMFHYGSPTWKRHYLFGNSPWYSSLDLGPLQRVLTKRQEPKEKVVTVRKYKDKAGKARYQGTAQLRGTENLDFSHAMFHKGPRA